MQIQNSLSAPLAMTALFVTLTALAQDASPLDIATTVQKEETVVTAAGEESTRLVPAEKVLPGDHVVYTVRYTNTGDAALENVVITNPLPAELSYVDNTATGVATTIEFSVDGGKHYADADSLVVDSESGQRPATASDFTHIRWVVQESLSPGAEGIATFRARLN